jgi:hypothetical protein
LAANGMTSLSNKEDGGSLSNQSRSSIVIKRHPVNMSRQWTFLTIFLSDIPLKSQPCYSMTS